MSIELALLDKINKSGNGFFIIRMKMAYMGKKQLTRNRKRSMISFGIDIPKKAKCTNYYNLEES